MKTTMIVGAIGALLLCGCAAVQVPPNVAVNTRSDGAGTIRSIDFSYNAQGQPSFKQLKLCVAENVANDAVTLRGGDQVVATRWGILQHGDTDTVAGGDLFRYADDEAQVLIVSGTADGGGDSIGLVSYSLKFRLKGSITGNRVGLLFSNISQAQKNTGSMANDGFSPVGTWAGGGAMRVYNALNAIASEIKACEKS